MATPTCSDRSVSRTPRDRGGRSRQSHCCTSVIHRPALLAPILRRQQNHSLDRPVKSRSKDAVHARSRGSLPPFSCCRLGAAAQTLQFRPSPSADSGHTGLAANGHQSQLCHRSNSLTPSGELQGLNVDMMKEVAHRLCVPMDVRPDGLPADVPRPRRRPVRWHRHRDVLDGGTVPRSPIRSLTPQQAISITVAKGSPAEDHGCRGGIGRPLRRGGGECVSGTVAAWGGQGHHHQGRQANRTSAPSPPPQTSLRLCAAARSRRRF